MDGVWLLLVEALIVVAAGFAGLMLLHAVEILRFARARIGAADRTAGDVRVEVFVPCKGLDLEFARNLQPVFEQDHPQYGVTFMVESRDDPAHDALVALAAQNPHVPVRILETGQATTCGQKVHNLRAATAELDEAIDVLAFMDSDARPAKHWLQVLTRRLSDEGVGASTGYRWFVPARPSLANLLLYGVNASLAASLGPGGHHLLWGGSWATRRETFERLAIRDAWKGTLSDDLVASRVIAEAGLEIQFEPACVVPSPIDVDAAGMFEFVRRQYLIARIYAHRWWWLAVGGAVLMNLALFGGLATIVVQWAGGSAPSVWLTGPWLLLVALTFVRGAIRQRLAGIYLSAHLDQLRAARWFDLIASPVAGLVNWIGLGLSALGREITWRGIRYRLTGDGQVQIVARNTAAAGAASAAPEPHFSATGQHQAAGHPTDRHHR